jgi:hypothetical protein
MSGLGAAREFAESHGELCITLSDRAEQASCPTVR